MSRRQPFLTDSLLAAVLAILTAPDVVARHGSESPAAIALHVALWVPIAFRRQAPELVFGVTAGIAFVQWLVSVPVAADAALLIALYTVAAHRRLDRALAAAAVLEFGVALAVLRWGSGPSTLRLFLLLTGMVLAALLLGVTQRSRRAYLAQLVDRAERLERERDQQAQLATAAERTRIAREMHDIVAHSLSVMITLADGAALTDQPDQARGALHHISRTGRDALADTRRVLGVLCTAGRWASKSPCSPGRAGTVNEACKPSRS
jgi:signal transduction histidine kinase